MLYFAPINLYANYVYRHLLLRHGADFVFSELILIHNLEAAIGNDKLKMIESDLPQTIFQIGVRSPKEVHEGVAFLKKTIGDIREININMGCPQSTMQREKICGGILYDIPLMGELAKALSSYKDFIPSTKIRLGTSEEEILVDKYLSALRENGINKVYIHARPLRYGYPKPCLHHHFDGLKEKFSDMTLVFNGDCDGPDIIKKYGDYLIGRAALSNPLIFEDIKKGVSYRSGPYDPILKDPHLERGEKVWFKKSKIAVLIEFLELAVEHNLRRQLVLSNIAYLCKGVSDYKTFSTQVRETETNEEILDAFRTWVGK